MGGAAVFWTGQSVLPGRRRLCRIPRHDARVRIEEGPFEFVPEESLKDERVVLRRIPSIPMRDEGIEIEEVWFIISDRGSRQWSYLTGEVNAIYDRS